MRIKTLFLTLLLFGFGLTEVSAQNEGNGQAGSVPKQISAGVLNGKAKTLIQPAYPAAAKAVKATGAVNVQITIDEQGNVISASAVSGHPLLRAAAVEAARASQFAPTLLSGQPVKVTGVIVYNFVLDTPAEFKEPYWALGFVVSLVQNAVPQLIAELDKDEDPANNEGFDSILTGISKDVPDEFAAQKPLFAKLETARGEERRQAAAELNISLKNQLREGKLWQYDVGENLGVIIFELVKYKAESNGANYRMDETALRASLENIKKSLGSMPAGTSPEFAQRIAKIAAYSDSEDLTGEKTINELFSTLEPLFESLDNDE